jgi:hypothetical protein
MRRNANWNKSMKKYYICVRAASAAVIITLITLIVRIESSSFIGVRASGIDYNREAI